MLGLRSFGLNAAQLEAVMTTAAKLPTDKRVTFAELVRARLEQRGLTKITDADLHAVIASSLTGLVHNSAA